MQVPIFAASRRALVAVACAIVLVPVQRAHAEDRATPEPLKVCLVSGSLEYESDKTLSAFQEYVESRYPVVCSRAFYREIDDLPGLEALDDCDVMVLFTRRMELKGEQLQRIKNYCLSGRPIVGVRTASHAIQTWLELDREILGGNYRGHYGNELKTHISIVDGAADHPILRGFEPFVSDGSLYRNQGVADDVEVLLEGSIPDHTEPIAWTREYKGARIFYTSLGHQHDFENEGFRRMLVNALFWTTHREPVPLARANDAP